MTEKSLKSYTEVFFEALAPGSRQSASIVVPLVNEIVRPRSVLDVGCGVGTWLAEWMSNGVSDVVGIDGAYVDETAMQIASSGFVPADLREPFSLGRRFDLAQSLEVAEHLDERYADTFVHCVTAHADVVMFSAAIPGQGGTHHVNEQWPSYWVEKFAKAGLQLFDVIRPAIWGDDRVDWWYRQNILLFAKSLAVDVRETCLDIVHPAYLKTNPRRRDPVWQRFAASRLAGKAGQ